MAKDKKHTKQKVSNTTTFSGPVTARAISTGSGDINITSPYGFTDIQNREDFLEYIALMKQTLSQAKSQGLSAEIADPVEEKLEAAQEEAKKEKPQAASILDQLNKAKEIVTAGSAIITTSSAIMVTVDKLIPTLNHVINSVGQLF